MIAFLRGRVLDKQPNRIIVDVGGVGYDVQVPLSTFYEIGEEGVEVTLRVYTHVREDALQLYGFLTDLERQVFERLIGISGIGPKLAIAVLSGMDSREVISAIQRADVARLTGIPGIGKKTAERIVVELRDKLSKQPLESSSNISPFRGNTLQSDALNALIALGINRQAADQAIQKVLEQDPGVGVELMIKKALQIL